MQNKKDTSHKEGAFVMDYLCGFMHGDTSSFS